METLQQDPIVSLFVGTAMLLEVSNVTMERRRLNQSVILIVEVLFQATLVQKKAPQFALLCVQMEVQEM